MTAATRTPTITPVRRRLGREERSASIIAAATHVFAESGFAGTSMADIASAAGVSHLIVYRHFESKEAIYRAVLERALANLDEALSVADATGQYGPTTTALLASARADADAFRVLWRHAVHEPDFSRVGNAARRRVMRPTITALESLVPHDHLRWAARATMTYVVEAVLVWIEDGDAGADDRFIAATDAAMRAGVRSWAKPSRSARRS